MAFLQLALLLIVPSRTRRTEVSTQARKFWRNQAKLWPWRVIRLWSDACASRFASISGLRVSALILQFFSPDRVPKATRGHPEHDGLSIASW